MTTKRTPRRHEYNPPISAEALAVWRQLQSVKHRGDEWNRLDMRLCTLTGLWWGDCISPLDAKSPTVPESYRHRELRAEAYRAAHRVYLALIAAEAADQEPPPLDAA
jgi:hypothetical protein